MCVLQTCYTYVFISVALCNPRKMPKDEEERKTEKTIGWRARAPDDLNTKSPFLVQFSPASVSLSFSLFSPLFVFRPGDPYGVSTSTCVPRVFLGVTRFLCAPVRPDYYHKNNSAQKTHRALLKRRLFYLLILCFSLYILLLNSV